MTNKQNKTVLKKGTILTTYSKDKYKIIKVKKSSGKVIGGEVEYIGNKKKLKNVTIGRNVKTIGSNAFKDCKKLIKKAKAPKKVKIKY